VKVDPITDPMMVRLIEALESSAKVNAEVVGQVKGLEHEWKALQEAQVREFTHLRETFDRQLRDVEDEMKSNNSHLDNLVRETVVTNELLREDLEERKTAAAHRLKVEGDEREWRRKMEIKRLDRSAEIEDDNRNQAKKYADEMWAIFKQPLGYLIAGIIFWVVTTQFKDPPRDMLPQTAPVPQVEAAL